MRSLTVLLMTLALACGDDKSDDDDGADDTGATEDGGGSGDAGGDDGGSGDGGGGSGCPDDVPEEYMYIWDCAAATCDAGQRRMYHWGSGASTDAGRISADEHWFMFWDDGASWCTDSFTFTGSESQVDPTTYGCSQCEGLYNIDMEMTSDNSCGLTWGSLINDDDENATGPFEGVLMFDTHTAFGDRNPDDAMLVYSGFINDGLLYTNSEYARGTATPTGDEDAAPEDYQWANGGVCVTMGR